MQDESTSMEVDGAKGASTLASASDASATSTMSAATLSSSISSPISALPRVGVTDGATHLGGASIASGSDAAANEIQVTPSPTPHSSPGQPAQGARAEAQGTKEEEDETPSDPPPAKAAVRKGNEKKHTNNLRKLRIERMMSKAELARRANLSVLTIDRIEKGFGCRMDSKRKILEALGLSLADRVRVFGEEE
jgi:DNA-binding XRE family transcriptional regulator